MTTSTPVPALFDEWIQATAPAPEQEPAQRCALAEQKAEQQRGRVERLKDPFSPIAEKDPAALKKEIILWEDDDVMVIVDAFAYGPKALVVPKEKTLFPTDVDEEMLKRLAVISARVSDAFLQQGANGPARMWINPPSALTVRQLHVHVQPGIPRPDDNNAFYASLSAYLQTKLSS
ncbi:MAG: HIT domain-containing protein [Deltaproteobacteria bacterium]|nr:HIT domain-containing protein [Deltaproteobacteria bacterium]